MKFRFLISTPFAVNQGGTSTYAGQIIKEIASAGFEILPLDFTKTEIDFDWLLVLSYSYHNPDMLESYKTKGIKIIVIPIFDRIKHRLIYDTYKVLAKLPFPTLYDQRKRVLECANILVVSCQEEKYDLIKCYNIEEKKIKVLHLAFNSDIIEIDKQIDSSIFENQYGKHKYVLFSAAEINERKNQMSVIKAIEGTNFKLILTGTHQVKVKGFWQEVQKNPNIICLGKVSINSLVSIYKSSHVSISTSCSETAGLALLESAYFGCNLVVSDIPAFREYLEQIATFFNKKQSKKDILQKIEKAIKSPKNINQKQFVANNYSWKTYIDSLISEVTKLN